MKEMLSWLLLMFFFAVGSVNKLGEMQQDVLERLPFAALTRNRGMAAEGKGEWYGRGREGKAEYHWKW